MKTDPEYIKQLEETIKQMLHPIKNIPLKLVIESISGCKVIPFNKEDNKDQDVLKKLVEVAKVAGVNINKKGIARKRPNEVGNDIEPYVLSALQQLGYRAKRPKTKTGKNKSVGYPDIEFLDQFERTNYLECKTYNIENVATTQRSFYLSPSEDFKITKDARHFIISFEIVVDGSQGNMNIYKCKAWKILSAEKLLVDVKYEFNSDNARMYQSGLLLAEGKL